jgi:hypothetical protein
LRYPCRGEPHFHFRLPKLAHLAVEAEARRIGISPSAYVRALVIAGLTKRQENSGVARSGLHNFDRAIRRFMLAYQMPVGIAGLPAVEKRNELEELSWAVSKKPSNSPKPRRILNFAFPCLSPPRCLLWICSASVRCTLGARLWVQMLPVYLAALKLFVFQDGLLLAEYARGVAHDEILKRGASFRERGTALRALSNRAAVALGPVRRCLKSVPSSRATSSISAGSLRGWRQEAKA